MNGVIWEGYRHEGAPTGQRLNNLRIKNNNDSSGVKHYHIRNIQYVKIHAFTMVQNKTLVPN